MPTNSEGGKMELSGELILGICSTLGAAFVGGCGWVWSLARKMSEHESRWETAATTRQELAELKRDLDEIRAAVVRNSHQYSHIDAKLILLVSLLQTTGAKIDLAKATEAMDYASESVRNNGK